MSITSRGNHLECSSSTNGSNQSRFKLTCNSTIIISECQVASCDLQPHIMFCSKSQPLATTPLNRTSFEAVVRSLECFEHFDYIVGANNESQVFVAASISRMCGCCRDSLRASRVKQGACTTRQIFSSFQVKRIQS